MHKKLLLFLFILMTMPAALFAQEPVMNVRSRQSAAAGQPFQITFEVNGKAANFKMPTFKNLTLVGGPSTGYSSSTSIINGQMTQSVTYTYTIIVQADNVGTANVGVASCTVDGKSVTSKPFSIKIEKPDPNRQQQQQQQQAASSWPFGNPSRPQRQQQQQPAQQQPQTIDNNTLFARASINKSNLYQGEEAIIVYKIYTQVPLTQFQIDKLPRNKGFWSEDLSEGQTQVRQYTETYNGRQYQVAEIRRGALYPQETGRLNIAPLKTDVVAIVQTQAQRQRTGTILDFFIDDPFFSIPQQQAVVKSLTSNALNVNVKPLPEAPAGFAGGVGNFSVSAKTDLTQLHANEAFTYSVTVSGRGNLSLLETPQIEFPKGMEVYEPRVIDNINKGDNGLSGSRTFEWIVTPQSQGEYDMPAFSYVYFDPAQGQYVTKQCNSIHIKVDKPLHNATAKSDVKELNSDIHHIVKRASLRHGSNARPSLLFWLLLLLPVVAMLVIILLARRQQDIADDEGSMKLQRATKLAKKRLRNAERHLHDGNDELFYEEIYKALWGGIADKFNIQQSLLSSETIQRHLADKQVEPALQERILQTLKDVDFARFAPGDSSAIKQTIYDEAMNTIMQIGAIKVKDPRKQRTAASATLLLLLALATSAQAATAQADASLFQQANTAYDSGNYEGALEAYSQLLDDGVCAWQLYYNMGNAHYRLDNIGQAILCYERALRLAPNQTLVSDNLALARSRTQDNIEQLPKFFLWQWVDAVVQQASPKGWRTAIVILVFLFCTTLSIFFIARRYRLRRSMFIVSALLLLFLLVTTLNATFASRNATNNTEAIVTAPMLIVKGSPDAKSVDKFILHEGTKLTIEDEQDSWWQIKIADGKSGWVNGGAERI